MIKLIERHPLITITATAVIMLLSSANYLEISIMEARNFITAREMITDSNWLLTTMNGEPRYQKPPLPSWLAALFALVFGLKSILTYRIPGILMVVILGLTAYFFTKKIVQNKLQALVNGLITITSFYTVAIVFEAPSDIFTHSFMLLGLYHVFLHYNKDKNYWLHSVLAGLFIGCSILSKGPVSLYVLCLPFLISYGFVYKFKKIKTKVFSTLSLIIIAFVVGGWWYVYIHFKDPATLLEMANEETSNWSRYNVRPFYYYWSFFAQSGLWTIPAFISLLYPYLKSRVSHLKAYRFSFYWTIIAVILLSIIPEKKSRYLMPVLIPLAINIGFYIEYLFGRFKDLKDKRETIPVFFNFGLIALVGCCFSLTYFFFRDFQDFIWLQFTFASILLFLVGLSIFYYLKRREIKAIFYLSILFMLLATVLIIPFSRHLKPYKYQLITELKTTTELNGITLYNYKYVPPEMIWHYDNKIPSLNDTNHNFPKGKVLGVLIHDANSNDLNALKENYEIEYIKTYDLNSADKNSRSYTIRLVNSFYKLTKK